jgi:hypothetical protein
VPRVARSASSAVPAGSGSGLSGVLWRLFVRPGRTNVHRGGALHACGESPRLFCAHAASCPCRRAAAARAESLARGERFAAADTKLLFGDGRFAIGPIDLLDQPIHAGAKVGSLQYRARIAVANCGMPSGDSPTDRMLAFSTSTGITGMPLAIADSISRRTKSSAWSSRCAMLVPYIEPPVSDDRDKQVRLEPLIFCHSAWPWEGGETIVEGLPRSQDDG